MDDFISYHRYIELQLSKQAQQDASTSSTSSNTTTRRQAPRSLLLLQQDLFVMTTTTVFRNLEEERIWDIDQSVRERFNAKIMYELALREDIPWRQWNRWTREKIVTWLKENNRIVDLPSYNAHYKKNNIYGQQNQYGLVDASSGIQQPIGYGYNYRNIPQNAPLFLSKLSPRDGVKPTLKV